MSESPPLSATPAVPLYVSRGPADMVMDSGRDPLSFLVRVEGGALGFPGNLSLVRHTEMGKSGTEEPEGKGSMEIAGGDRRYK